MSVLNEIHRVTKELFTHLQKTLPKDDREQYIEVINRLLDERDMLLKQLQGGSAK